MTDKNVKAYASSNWSSYLKPISYISQNSKGIPLIESEKEFYSFDEISKHYYQSRHEPTSVDAIAFSNFDINLIEFKSGFEKKITTKNYSEEKAKCDYSGEICNAYWNLFDKVHKKETKELIDSIKLKAIESYFTLEKHIFPECGEVEEQKYRIKLTVVIDANPNDSYEDLVSSLSGCRVERNTYTRVRDSLRRFQGRTDVKGNTYLYDEINVISSQEFLEKHAQEIGF